MNKKTHISIFLIIAASLILILFSPLDYVNLDFAYYHLWFTLIYGVFVMIVFSKNKDIRKKRIIGSIIAVPIVVLISVFYYLIGPDNEVKITPVPKSKMILTSQFYTLFMMGDPRIDITIGYPVICNQVIWRVNSYTKYGEGESEEELSPYVLPKGIKTDDYGLFILEEENYLFESGDNKVYKVKKKK